MQRNSRAARMKYDRCSTAELAKFCTSRGLTVDESPVPDTDRQSRQLHRHLRLSYIAALQAADANPGPFRFFGLSPELRTNVYEKLLVFNDSFSCHPQILRASKQINAEATNILYGDNLIEIKLYEDGMYIHGKVYEALPGSPLPQFLHKVQFMSWSLGKFDPTAAPRMFSRRSCEYKLHRICMHLMGKNKLRSMEVDFTHPPPAIGSPAVTAPFDVYGLRLLGPLKACVVKGLEGTIFEHQPDADSDWHLRKFSLQGPPTWMEHYAETCYEKWNKFLIDCYRYNGTMENAPLTRSREQGRAFAKAVKEALLRRVQQGKVRYPDKTDDEGEMAVGPGGNQGEKEVAVPWKERIQTKYNDDEAHKVFRDFMIFVEDVRLATYVHSDCPNQDIPGFLEEFLHFDVDAQIRLDDYSDAIDAAMKARGLK